MGQNRTDRIGRVVGSAKAGSSTAIALWVLLVLLLVFLIFVAVLLFIGSNLLSPDDLTADESTNLWAFLGVAFGVVATLIGALLTNQHNRRTHQLARETEERLKIDTVAKVLELVTVDGAYAPRARVAGAIATLMELHGDAVSVRILGELWNADAVDSSTAVWLIDCVLSDSSAKDAETSQAAQVLALHVARVVPSRQDPHQELFLWPLALTESWPSGTSFGTRNALIVAVSKVLLVRELTWWQLGALRTPVRTLVNALEDPELGSCAALILEGLVDRNALGTASLGDDEIARIKKMASTARPTGWFATVLAELHAWADGRQGWWRF